MNSTLLKGFHHRDMRIIKSLLILPALLSLSGISVVRAQQVVEAQRESDTRSTRAQPNKNALSRGYTSQDKIKINLAVQDSSLEYVIFEIARQAKLRVVGDDTNPFAGKKVSVKLTGANVMEAYSTVLKGTGLSARIASDSETVIISRSSQKSDSAEVAGNHGTVSGSVTDSASGNPVKGVTIAIKGSNLRATTDEKGRYAIAKVPAGEYVIEFRLVGFNSSSKQIKVARGQAVTANVAMSASSTVLADVVTTATGSQRRVEIANDIVKINADQIRERSPVRNVIDLIDAAQVPGVLVTRSGGDPGASSRIRIRGIGSISQSNDPVMIVDGIWIDASPSKPSRLDDIDPASIETIEIIRGPSAATLFGQDASNGVIVITTKKGKAGPTRWNIAYSRDWGQTYGRQPLFHVGVGSSPRFVEPQWCPISKVLSYECTQDSVIVLDPNNSLLSREGTETNNRYVAQMDGGSSSVTYALTFSTGNTIGVRRLSGVNKIRYRMLGYVPESEFTRPSELRRNTITSTFSFNPRPNLNLGVTMTGGQSSLKDNKISNTWNGIRSLGYTPDEFNIDTAFGATGHGSIQAIENPIKTSTAVISSSVQYRPRDAYVLNANLGVEKLSRNTSTFERITDCRITLGCNDEPGNRAEISEDGSVYTVRLNGSTNLNLGKLGNILEIRPSIGGDYKKTDKYQISINKSNVPVGDKSISSGTFSGSSNLYVDNAIAGWYINSTIGLFRRVYFDVGVRQDAGSAITSSNDATYPKLGGSWLLSDESFWRANSLVNSLRLRSAIGHAAVQPDPSDIHGKFVHGSEYIDGVFVGSSDLIATGNNRLAPERSIEFEIGFDADMFSDRLNLIGTYANKNNKNTLVVRTLPPSFGATQGGLRKENVARVNNQNFELSATGRVIEKRNLLAIVNYSLTLSSNKVVALGDGISPFTVNQSKIQAGYPLAGEWGRKVLGYRDANDDGLISESEVIVSDSTVYIGWSQPRYRASYGISVSMYNVLVLDSRFAYQSRYVQGYRQMLRYGGEDINAPLAEQAKFAIYGTNNERPVSDLRWNSASVTYNLPRSVLERFGGRAVSVSLQGSNLGLWTNYQGRDPGINSGILNGEGFGDDGLTPPRPRMYVLDFKVGF